MSESYTLFHTQFTSWKVYSDWLVIIGQTSQGLLYFTNFLFFDADIIISKYTTNTNIQPLFLFVELVLRLILLDVVLVPRLKVFWQDNIPGQDTNNQIEQTLHCIDTLALANVINLAK